MRWLCCEGRDCGWEGRNASTRRIPVINDKKDAEHTPREFLKHTGLEQAEGSHNS